MSDGGNDSEFVTVPDAARRLGLADRTAQRYAAKLADTDRTAADNGGPRLVRLSAIARIAKQSEVKRRQPMTGHAADIETPVADADRTPDRPVADDGKDALIEQLRGEVGFLRGALEQSNTNTERALVELSEARKQGQILIAATAQGRLIAPQENGTEKSELQKASEPVATVTTTEEVGPAATGTEGATANGEREATTAPWWAFWKAKSG